MVSASSSQPALKNITVFLNLLCPVVLTHTNFHPFLSKLYKKYCLTFLTEVTTFLAQINYMALVQY